MLVDTDVLIWALRGHHAAIKKVDTLANLSLSAVTYMELVQGMRNAKELATLRRHIRQSGWHLIPINEAISARATSYVENHYLSSSMQLADALIAATSMEHGLPLLSANSKHYRILPDLDLRIFNPSNDSQ